MRDYFRAVTLGAFTWRDERRIALLLGHVRGSGGAWLALHFLLLSACVNFPVTLALARVSPFEFFGRGFGADFMDTVPEFAGLSGELGAGEALDIGEFNLIMAEAGFGRSVIMPVLGVAFVLTLVLQAAFYLSAVFFLRVSRMNASFLTFRERMGLALYSSTLPVLLASAIGVLLPTVHIIACYLAIILIIFQRSSLCPNG